MSMETYIEKCPICGSRQGADTFQVADVWKDNKKQRLFVCGSCASKAHKKRKWTKAIKQ